MAAVEQTPARSGRLAKRLEWCVLAVVTMAAAWWVWATVGAGPESCPYFGVTMCFEQNRQQVGWMATAVMLVGVAGYAVASFLTRSRAIRWTVLIVSLVLIAGIAVIAVDWLTFDA
ncbi:hypothetical protein [Microbacterium sp. NIBRBAC000506063]|uniref:hypothetical protein n=1 Tax=Microbacterium sp. NIBRBAC000506063 TaxID=2734618 RepID=UPI001BB6E537|nr:hypothetical protein [Microbacterium sp. NIBRBAC000506063]QTV80352.1 hypothetical protein KAE78_05220 [Microbacterium sp. NIBRBAC000506063]